jgi:hypothetical protein
VFFFPRQNVKYPKKKKKKKKKTMKPIALTNYIN